MTDNIEVTPEMLTDRALRQMRNASDNLHRAERFTNASPPISRLLMVLANSVEFHGTTNRPQVEGALADYFDALKEA
jgi:hypothetical protein|tara:strand:+ start:91 stop:321 length:231 start_codon:yes stop_codon:yes gene_type:complete